MNILFCISRLSLGGHAISSLSLARELVARGHKVIYCSEDGPLREQLESSHIGWYALPMQRSRSRMALELIDNLPRLLRVIHREQIDIIHSHEVRRGIVAKYAASIVGVPTLVTVAGGPLPDIAPPKGEKLVLFSRELQEGFIRRHGWRQEDTYVIPSRVDIRRFNPAAAESSMARAFGIDCRRRNVLIMSRFESFGGKVDSLRYILEGLPRVHEAVPDLTAYLAGHGSKQPVVEEMVRQCNVACGREVLRMIGAVKDPAGLFPLFNLFIGLGRSALESMSSGVPAIIVGGRGYAGVVAEDTVEEIAFYNFSGRNAPGGQNDDRMAVCIARILNDSVLATELGEFGRRFVAENYDIKDGAQKIEQIYNMLLQNQREKGLLRRVRGLARSSACIATVYRFAAWGKFRTSLRLQ